VARYAFQLAQSFNNFYHQHHILSESDQEKRVFLLWMTQFFASQLARLLGILGISTPEVM
jgi:arginyl-tRNA synthetase